jgi:hypothetical protein
VVDDVGANPNPIVPVDQIGSVEKMQIIKADAAMIAIAGKFLRLGNALNG